MKTLDKLILNPRIGHKKNFWTASKVAGLLRRCQQDYGLEVWIVAGSSDQDYLAEVSAHLGEEINTISLSKLDNLAKQLKNSQLFIGADGGTSQLAVCLDVPAIILFGATKPSNWLTAVARNRVEVITKEVSCSPCSLSERHACQDKHCFSAISIEDVMARVKKIIMAQKEEISGGGTRI